MILFLPATEILDGCWNLDDCSKNEVITTVIIILAPIQKVPEKHSWWCEFKVQRSPYLIGTDKQKLMIAAGSMISGSKPQNWHKIYPLSYVFAVHLLVKTEDGVAFVSTD